MVTLPATTQDIGELFSTQQARDKEQNRRMLLKTISCVHVLAQQGLPLRGDGDERNRTPHLALPYHPLWSCSWPAHVQNLTNHRGDDMRGHFEHSH